MNNDSSYEHFVYFTYKVQWKVPNDLKPKGYLAINLPKSFPLKSQTLRIPINKRNGYFEQTLDTCVDDFFIDCAIRQSFINTIRYSKRSLTKYQDEVKNNKIQKTNNKTITEHFTQESIFLDAGVLFLPDRMKTLISVNMQIFEYLSITIQIDEPLLSIPHMKKFAPVILYLNQIHNILTSDQITNEIDPQHPIYIECKVGPRSYFLVPRFDKNNKNLSIDAAILISPGLDQNIMFKIYDGQISLLNTSFIGSGLYIDSNQVEEEEEEDVIENQDGKGDNQIMIVRSISEEKLLVKDEEAKKDSKHESRKHRHHHRSKTNSNPNTKPFLDTMKAVEMLTKPSYAIQFKSPFRPPSPVNTVENVDSVPRSPKTLNTEISYFHNNNKITASPQKIDSKSPRQSNKKVNSTTKTQNKSKDKTLNEKNPNSATHKTVTKKTQQLDLSLNKIVSPVENLKYGFCQFYLLPERKNLVKLNSSLNDNSYKDVALSYEIFTPASKFHATEPITQPIRRPLTQHKRPPNLKENKNDIMLENYAVDDIKDSSASSDADNGIETNHIVPNGLFFQDELNLDNMYPQDPKILAIEKPTTKLFRWVVSCSRFSPASLKLINFIQNFHRTTIHGFTHIKNPCLKSCIRKSVDLITCFHFVSPKEEIFLIETRAQFPNTASQSIEIFLRNEMPSGVHIIASTSIDFPAPRLYCCFEDLIHRVEIPISLNQMLQIDGLYLHKNRNHLLFPIVQKLANLLQAHKFKDIMNSFPKYSEICLLEKRNQSLFSEPLHKNLATIQVVPATTADFDDSNEKKANNPAINNNLVYTYLSNPNNSSNKPNIRKNERLTRYYFSKPVLTTNSKQRSESVGLIRKSKHIEIKEDQIVNENIVMHNYSVIIQPPSEIKGSKYAPRNIANSKY